MDENYFWELGGQGEKRDGWGDGGGLVDSKAYLHEIQDLNEQDAK